MHRLLQRQLGRHLDGAEAVPPRLQALLAAVDQAYQQSDADREMLERSLELSSTELLVANAALRGIVQAFPDELLHVAADGTILDHRGGAADSALRQSGRIVGLTLAELPVAKAAEKLSAAFSSATSRTATTRVEYTIGEGPDRRHFEARMLHLRGGEVMIIVRDISDLRRALELVANKAQELERSNAELQQFAYVASHDLQEPLRTVSSYLKIFEQRHAAQLEAQANELLQFAREGADRMRELIDDLLSYARLSSRATTMAPVLLDEVVDSVLGALRARIADVDATITRDSLPEVRGDVRQLEQLYQNLISNALKFVAPGTRPAVHLGARIGSGHDGAPWVLSVRDQGIGMEPKHLERVFEIFRRLHTREQYAGTGIGLAISKKIVEQHAGRIWVESEKGAGATFFFTLHGGGEAVPSG